MHGVFETNISKDDLSDSFAYHDELNVRLWKDDDLRLDVRVALLRAALAFAEYLNIPNLNVRDVIFTGSNAAYNYTEYSDLDIHLIVAYEDVSEEPLASNFFTAKKQLWNETHDISIRDYPVEMYVEDVTNPVTANGVFSLLKGEWIKKPTPTEPAFDDSAVLAKVEQCADEIDELLDNPNPLKAKIDDLIARVYRMRKAGLAENGEFSVENLAFKALRNLGYLDRLFKASNGTQDRDLSLESEEQ